MNLDYPAVVIAILAAILSGMGTAVIAGLRDNKKEMVIDYVGKIKRLLESYGVRCELEGKPSERIL